MTDLSQIWICGSMSEVVRADHINSFFASDGAPDNRAGESNYQGVLWALVAGRTEPVRVDGFVGATPAKILNEITQVIRGLIRRNSR